MEISHYWTIVKRRWKVIAACFLVVLALASAFTANATPQYEASTRLFVSTAPSDTADAYQGNLFATQRVASYADLVSSVQLATAVSKSLGGALDPVTLSKDVKATVVPTTVILEITATNANPALARDVANAYAAELSRTVRTLETPPAGGAPLVKTSIVDQAKIPTHPVSPKPGLNLTVAALLGLLMGLGAAVVRDLLDNTITTSDNVAEVTSAPILGHIHTDSAAIKREPRAALSNASPWAEAFRVLRTNMQYVDVDHEQKVFVVSSSLQGEGKSTTAINLAITLAMAESRVVLVECDLRRPTISDRLGLDQAVGTTNVLVGSVALEDAVQEYPGSRLSVLAAGPLPPNPSELLQSNAMDKLIVELRSQYDVVILDAPPLLPVTDAALLAARSDGAVVVVRHGRTTRDQLTHAIERLASVDAKTLGVVINMTRAKGSGSSYGYGYGYGSPYTEEPPAPPKGQHL